MGGIKNHNGPIMALGGINRYDEPNKINDVYFFPILLFFVCSFFYLGYVKFISYFLAPVEELFTKKKYRVNALYRFFRSIAGFQCHAIQKRSKSKSKPFNR